MHGREGPTLERNQALQPIPGFKSSVIFETNLTYFRPVVLECGHEDTTAGLDTLHAFFDFDGSPQPSSWCDSQWCTYLGDAFDDDVKKWIDFSPLRQSFAQQLTPNLYEEDDASQLFQTMNAGYGESSIDTIGALGPRVRGAVSGTFIWGSWPDPDWSEYWYEMGYQLSHEPL